MSGYDQFFKKAKQSKQKGASPADSGGKNKTDKTTAEEYLRSALKVKSTRPSRRRSSPPIISLIVVVSGLLIAALGYLFPEEFENVWDRFNIGVFSSADAAAEGTEAAQGPTANPASGTDTNPASSAGTADGVKSGECPEPKGFTQEELSHFNKLNERKRELDRRDTELTMLEEELHKQKKEVEARIVKLEQIREEVANVLKDKVEVDQQRVGTLVDFYSNMKPKQAAEIFSTLNEDLAVEVLGKMKKKNAADIMNLLNPTKARTLSEKFTGYKRR